MGSSQSGPLHRAKVYFGLAGAQPEGPPQTRGERARAILIEALIAGIVFGLLNWDVTDGLIFAAVFLVVLPIISTLLERRKRARSPAP